jgi:hypothetical protein
MWYKSSNSDGSISYTPKVLKMIRRIILIFAISVSLFLMNSRCLNSKSFSPGNITPIANFINENNDKYDKEIIVAINKLQDEGYLLTESEVDSLGLKIVQPHIKLYNLVPSIYSGNEYVVYCIRVYFGVKLIAININGHWYHEHDIKNETQREVLKKMTKKEIIDPIIEKIN